MRPQVEGTGVPWLQNRRPCISEVKVCIDIGMTLDASIRWGLCGGYRTDKRKGGSKKYSDSHGMTITDRADRVEEIYITSASFSSSSCMHFSEQPTDSIRDAAPRAAVEETP